MRGKCCTSTLPVTRTERVGSGPSEGGEIGKPRCLASLGVEQDGDFAVLLDRDG